MSTSNFSSDNYVAKEASSLIQKLSLLSSSENKQQSQSQSQQSQQQQSKLWIENNEDEKDVQNVDEDENDSDYEVNKEEEEEENEQEENDDKLLDEICVNDENEDENEQDLDNEEDLTDVKKELSEALDVVKNIALRHKEIIVSKIIDYQSSNGEEITSQNVQDAFKLLQKQLNQDEEEEEEEDDQDDQDNEDELQEEEEVDQLSSDNDIDEDELQQEEDELDVEIEDELEQNEIELSEEYDENDVEDLSAEAQQVLSEDIEEAMQIASELGKQARQELSSKYYESFIEITGEEPNQEQINAIFQRMQEELSNEAEEELFDNYEESYEDDCIDVTSILLNKISSLDNEEKKEFFEESQSLIPQETQNELKQQYIDSWGKEPNDEEFQNILITLAQTKFIDQYFADNINDNDSDYDPEQDSQQDEQENDEDEYSSDEDDELENLKKRYW